MFKFTMVQITNEQITIVEILIVRTAKLEMTVVDIIVDIIQINHVEMM